MATAGANALLTLVALATLTGCLWLWLIALARLAVRQSWLPAAAGARIESWLNARGYAPRQALVPWTSRRAVPWAAIDLLLLFGVWILAASMVQLLFERLGWALDAAGIEKMSPSQHAAQVIGNVAISLGILGIGLSLIAWRTGSKPSDFGLSLKTAAADLRLGALGFVILAPPVYALQGLLVTIWKPSKHPLMEMFKAAPDGPFFLLIFISAAVIAPLFEELVFRIVIQGFLEKWFSYTESLRTLLVGGPVHESASHTLVNSHSDGEEAPAPVAQAFDSSPNPYASPRYGGDFSQSHAAAADQPELSGAQGWLPIGISSAIFALLHYSHGPDWIPLLLLAAGMGYLYQRTHRLLPSLTVHALLNAFSLLALWVQVHAEK